MALELAAIDDRGSPLHALDARSRASLESELSRLDPATRKELPTNATAAGSRPLLHLAAYGALPVAYERLSSGALAADELVALRLADGDFELQGLSASVAAVAQLAARRVVRDALGDYQARNRWDARSLLRVANALQTLQSWQLLQRTLELLCELSPADEHRLRLARLLARTNDLSGAKQWLTGMSDKMVVRSRDQILAAIATIEAPPPVSVEQSVARARAELVLDRVEQARAVVEPLREQAPSHLALAATSIEVELGGQLCPSVLPGLGNAPLCAAAWRAANRGPAIEALLADAWASGKGRDPRAIETALGLRYVVPLLLRQSNDTANVQLLLSGLSASLGETPEGARSKALALFSQVVERAVTQAGKIDKQERKRWREQALAVYREDGGEPATVSTLLGMATWLAPSEDVCSLLDAVEPESITDPTLQAIWIKLNAVSALQTADPVRLEKSKALLPTWLQATDLPPQAHSEVLLLLAQADAALSPGQESKWRTVLHLSATAEAPLQKAAALAVVGQKVPALQLLEQLEHAAQAEGQEVSLKAVTGILGLGLRGLQAQTPADRAARAKEIRGVVQSAGSAVASAIGAWGELWARRMQLPDAQCAALLCAGKLSSQQQLRQRTDARTALLLERGVLPLGDLGLSWGYSFDQGLVPVVWVEPRWLAVP